MSGSGNSIREDEVDKRSEWDDGVEDGIRETNDEAVNDNTDLIVEDPVEGVNIDDI